VKELQEYENPELFFENKNDKGRSRKKIEAKTSFVRISH
jgi:hypothetical protein